jgi:hypothetical protein
MERFVTQILDLDKHRIPPPGIKAANYNRGHAFVNDKV